MIRRLTHLAAGHPAVLVCLLSLLYFAIALLLASKKIFWNDELFTFYISRRPSFSDVWAALLTGAEQLPPLSYVITRACTAVFGSGYVAFRLPEMAGFWVMAVCLYRFVSQRTTKAYGLIAMAFPLATESLSYSVEARPYGLVLGFSGAALVFWQAASEGKYRPLSLVGLGLSLAGAISCHYYGVLVFLPFALGEAVRFAVRRKLDFGVASAVAAGVLPLAIYLPLIRAASAFSGTFWAKPQWSSIIAFYQYLLIPALLLLFSIPMVLAISEWFRTRKEAAPDASCSALPLWEVAAAAGFALIPMVAVILAKTITGAFTDRYALPAVLGIAILLSWSISVLGRNRAGVALVIAGIATGVFVLTAARAYRYNLGLAANARAEISELEKITRTGTAPVVVASPHRFLEYSHLAGVRGLTSAVYLADRDLALRHTGTDDVELGLLYLKAWAPLRVERFRDFVGKRKEFTLLDDGQPFAWALQELTREGWQFALVGNVGSVRLYKASPPQLHGTSDSAGRTLPLPIVPDRE